MRYGDLLVENRKLSPPFSHLTPSIGVASFEFLEKSLRILEVVIHRADSKDFVILACVVLIRLHGVTDRQAGV